VYQRGPTKVPQKKRKKAGNYMCLRNKLLAVIMETFTFIRFLSMFLKPRMVQISAKCPLVHIIFCLLWCNKNRAYFSYNNWTPVNDVYKN